MKLFSLRYLKRNNYIFYKEFNDWIKWIEHEIIDEIESPHSYGVALIGMGISKTSYNAWAIMCCDEYEEITDIEKC